MFVHAHRVNYLSYRKTIFTKIIAQVIENIDKKFHANPSCSSGDIKRARKSVTKPPLSSTYAHAHLTLFNQKNVLVKL